MTEFAPSPAQQIEALAPYPDPGMATADALARHFTVQAFASACRLHGHPTWTVPRHTAPDGTPVGIYADALREFNRDAELAWTQYAAAYLLREAGTWREEYVDELAKGLRRDDDTSEEAFEALTGWLDEYGIDPERIVQAVRAERGLP